MSGPGSYWIDEEQDDLHFYDKSLPVTEQGFSKINVTHEVHPLTEVHKMPRLKDMITEQQ